MQVIQKIFVEVQEIIDNNKIKTGHFWFQGEKYDITNGKIQMADRDIKQESI